MGNVGGIRVFAVCFCKNKWFSSSFGGKMPSGMWDGGGKQGLVFFLKEQMVLKLFAGKNIWHGGTKSCCAPVHSKQAPPRKLKCRCTIGVHRSKKYVVSFFVKANSCKCLFKVSSEKYQI